MLNKKKLIFFISATLSSLIFAQPDLLTLPNIQNTSRNSSAVPTANFGNLTIYTCPSLTTIQSLRPRNQITPNRWVLTNPISTQQWPSNLNPLPTTIAFTNSTEIPVTLSFNSAIVNLNNTNTAVVNTNSTVVVSNNNVVVNASLAQAALRSSIQLVNILINTQLQHTIITCVYNVNFKQNPAVVQTSIRVPFSLPFNREVCRGNVGLGKITCPSNSPVCKGSNCPQPNDQAPGGTVIQPSSFNF